MKKYKSRGVVLGNLWQGGRGFYPAEGLEAKTKAELLKKAKEMLKSGALDSGMGFDGLNSAYLMIEEIETIKKNGKEYKNNNFFDEFIGKPSEEEKKQFINITL